VVVDVEHLWRVIVGAEHRLCEGGLDRHGLARLGECLEAGPQGAQVGEGLCPHERPGVGHHEVFGPLQR